MWSSAAVAHRLQGFDVLCVQGCFSVCHCAIRWLFQLLLPSCQLEPVWPFSCVLSHNKPYSPTVLTLTAFFWFCFSQSFLYKLTIYSVYSIFLATCCCFIAVIV